MRIAARPDVGPSLADLVATHTIGAKIISNERPYPRSSFFIKDEIPPETEFGNTFNDPSYRTIAAPPIFQTLPTPGILVGTDGIIIYNDQVLLDTIRHVSYWLPDSLTRTLQNHDWIEFRQELEVNRRVTGPHFCGFAGSWRNYAHWMNESLPRLYAFLVEKDLTPSMKLLLPALDNAQAESVAIMGINPNDIITVLPGDVIACDELCTISAIDIWTVPKFLRKAATFLGNQLNPQLLNTEGSESIYIHRGSGTRRVTNFEKVRLLLDTFGFQVVNFDGISLTDQIKVMRGARHVVGEHGAGLANILLMKPGGAVLELFNHSCVQPAYWSLSSLMDHKFGYLIANSQGSADWNSDYIVDLDRLTAGIELMLNA